jgi:AraC-like DNA-binding protein
MRVTELASSRAVLPSPADAGHPPNPVARPGMRERTVSERRLLYLRARLIVKRHYARQLTVAVVAKALASSPRQLQRAYEQFGDRSFREDLRGRRMDAAVELLATPAIPVSEVARLVGYRQAPHFARAFRSAYGVSPSAFRARVHHSMKRTAETGSRASESPARHQRICPSGLSTLSELSRSTCLEAPACASLPDKERRCES